MLIFIGSSCACSIWSSEIYPEAPWREDFTLQKVIPLRYTSTEFRIMKFMTNTWRYLCLFWQLQEKRTALSYAVCNKHQKIEALLLAADAQPGLVNIRQVKLFPHQEISQHTKQEAMQTVHVRFAQSPKSSDGLMINQQPRRFIILNLARCHYELLFKQQCASLHSTQDLNCVSCHAGLYIVLCVTVWIIYLFGWKVGSWHQAEIAQKCDRTFFEQNVWSDLSHACKVA